MRIWLLLLMVIIGVLSPLLRSSIKNPTSIRAAFDIAYNRSLHRFSAFSLSTKPLGVLQGRILSTMASAENAKPTPAEPEPVASKLAGASNTEPTLPKLSADDFRTYNRLAVMMDYYHNHFRSQWQMLYKACSSSSRPAGVSMRAFLSTGLNLCRSLTVHHTIEENHVFPELAERMPIFEPNETLITQHEQIHEGLEKFEGYLQACLYGEKELRMDEMKRIMDAFGEVLWTHLDLEVKMLGAENMRKYWSKEEILSMNW